MMNYFESNFMFGSATMYLYIMFYIFIKKFFSLLCSCIFSIKLPIKYRLLLFRYIALKNTFFSGAYVDFFWLLTYFFQRFLEILFWNAPWSAYLFRHDFFGIDSVHPCHLPEIISTTVCIEPCKMLYTFPSTCILHP